PRRAGAPALVARLALRARARHAVVPDATRVGRLRQRPCRRDHPRRGGLRGAARHGRCGTVRAVPGAGGTARPRPAARAHPHGRAHGSRPAARNRGAPPRVRWLVHRFARILGTLLIAAGVLTLAWVVVVWRWEDPFTALYTHYQQARLSHTYEKRAASFQPRVSDFIHFELPYGVFTYRVTRHYVVTDNAVAVLQNHGREILRLQACHPRFFATHRYIVDAKLVAVSPTGGTSYSPRSAAT